VCRLNAPEEYDEKYLEILTGTGAISEKWIGACNFAPPPPLSEG